MRASGGGPQGHGGVHLPPKDARGACLRQSHRSLDEIGEERSAAAAAVQARLEVGGGLSGGLGWRDAALLVWLRVGGAPLAVRREGGVVERCGGAEWWSGVGLPPARVWWWEGQERRGSDGR